MKQMKQYPLNPEIRLTLILANLQSRSREALIYADFGVVRRIRERLFMIRCRSTDQ